MAVSDINIFYDQHVDARHNLAEEFVGHFDFLLWENLKKNLAACERLQRKPFYKIALVCGDATYQSKSKRIAISGYNIVFSDPMARFAFQTNDKEFEGKYCLSNEAFLRGTSKFNLHTLPIFQNRELYIKSLSQDQYHELTSLFDQIEIEHKSVYPFREQLIRNRIFDVIHYVQKLDFTIQNAKTTSNKSLEEQFLKTLEHAFADINGEKRLISKSPSYYAGQLNTTVDHLNKILKTSSGKTTQTIIQERIIEEANVLLRHTSLTVKEIAWCLHFQETAHFQNFYKRQTGSTPIAYRIS